MYFDFFKNAAIEEEPISMEPSVPIEDTDQNQETPATDESLQVVNEVKSFTSQWYLHQRRPWGFFSRISTLNFLREEALKTRLHLNILFSARHTIVVSVAIFTGFSFTSSPRRKLSKGENIPWE